MHERARGFKRCASHFQPVSPNIYPSFLRAKASWSPKGARDASAQKKSAWSQVYLRVFLSFLDVAQNRKRGSPYLSKQSIFTLGEKMKTGNKDFLSLSFLTLRGFDLASFIVFLPSLKTCTFFTGTEKKKTLDRTKHVQLFFFTVQNCYCRRDLQWNLCASEKH